MNAYRMFPEVPLMDTKHVQVGEPVHYGAGNYVITIDGTTAKDYYIYLQKLEECGFEKHVDNGNGVGRSVYNSIFVKDKWVFNITHVDKQNKTYISACFDTPLSEHLFYKKKYVQDNVEGSKTKLHMLEMWNFGNSFVIQLKNKHFIVSDGGMPCECPYLLDYLESLAPEGEKPIVEAWIFSHGHSDHCGVMAAFFDNKEYVDRIYVEGVYYNEPNDSVTALDEGARITLSWIKGAVGRLKTRTGTHPQLYRPQTGQRYYFNDITMDIVLAQEQLPLENYSGDFNDSSTWCMFTIEGQKCLFCGDGEKGGMRFLMEAYDKEYLTVDVFTLMHHGFNTRDEFTDYCTVNTALLTTRDDLPIRKAKENKHLKQSVKEWFAWGDGTKVMTFPYKIGTIECMPKFDWKYNKGEKRPVQPNIYTLPT